MTAAPRPARRDALGYAIVVLSYLGMAGAGPLVAWADAPEAVMLCARMAFAALEACLALGVLLPLRSPLIQESERAFGDCARNGAFRAIGDRALDISIEAGRRFRSPLAQNTMEEP